MRTPVLQKAVRLTDIARVAGRFVRSTNAVLIARLAFDFPNAATSDAIVPKTTRVAIFTTRPFARVFSRTVQIRPGAGAATFYGALGRSRLPVRGGMIVSP